MAGRHRAHEACDLNNQLTSGFGLELKSRNFTAVLRIEKSGRGGKTVTVIDQLPKIELFLKALCSELKKKCGAGGTYLMDRKEGVIEIQGERRDQIRALLEAKDFKVKG